MRLCGGRRVKRALCCRMGVHVVFSVGGQNLKIICLYCIYSELWFSVWSTWHTILVPVPPANDNNAVEMVLVKYLGICILYTCTNYQNMISAWNLKILSKWKFFLCAELLYSTAIFAALYQLCSSAVGDCYVCRYTLKRRLTRRLGDPEWRVYSCGFVCYSLISAFAFSCCFVC